MSEIVITVLIADGRNTMCARRQVDPKTPIPQLREKLEAACTKAIDDVFGMAEGYSAANQRREAARAAAERLAANA